jgi:cell division protein FtsL
MNIRILLKDTFNPRTSFNLLLGGVAFALAIFLIYVKDQYRQHFIQLESLKAEHGRLETEWSELLLEESTWSSRTRVTNLARQKLGMVAIQPADIRMLSLEQLQADAEN